MEVVLRGYFLSFRDQLKLNLKNGKGSIKRGPIFAVSVRKFKFKRKEQSGRSVEETGVGQYCSLSLLRERGSGNVAVSVEINSGNNWV